MKGCLLTFVISLIIGLSSCATVISIDFGEEMMKIAGLGYSLPMNLILNGESKRMTETILSITKSERKFGADASAAAARYPESSYAHLKSLVGKLYDSDAAKRYREQFSNGMKEDEVRKTIVFEDPNFGSFYLEELVAMMLAHGKKLAEADTGRIIENCVISVPAYFNLFERQALLDAAKLAGLHVLELINDTTAAALQFAVTRHKFSENSTYNVFYDIGSGSAVASVVSFQNAVFNETNRNVTKPVIEVHSMAYDETLGGFEIDQRLKNLLASKFLQKYPQAKITPKGSVKLLKEANRLKKVLNANQEAFSNVDSLYEDYSLSFKVTRSELESLLEDWPARLAKVLNDSLASANVTLEQIDSVLMIGSTSRVLKVLSALKDVAGDKLASTMNAEESVAFGGVIRAAEVSGGFVVKQKYVIIDHVRMLNQTELEANGISIPPLTDEQKIQCRERLFKLDEAERKAREHSEVRNGVESFVYKAREDLESENYSKYIVDAEKDSLAKRMDEIMEHLEVYGENEETANLKALRTELDTLAKPLYFRKVEFESREKSIPALKTVLEKATRYSTESKKIPAEERGPTDEELDSLLATVTEHKAWMENVLAEQSKLPINADPFAFSAEFETRAKLVDFELSRLQKKKKPYRPKPVVPDTKQAEVKSDDGKQTEEKEASKGNEKEGTEQEAEPKAENETPLPTEETSKPADSEVQQDSVDESQPGDHSEL